VEIAGNKQGEEIVYWNPVLFIPDRSRPQQLHVFFKKFTPIPVWITFWTSSDDGGETWSEPRELVPGLYGKRGRGPQKNPPVVLSNGDWLSAGSYEVTNPPGSEAYGVWVRSLQQIIPSPFDPTTSPAPLVQWLTLICRTLGPTSRLNPGPAMISSKETSGPVPISSSCLLIAEKPTAAFLERVSSNLGSGSPKTSWDTVT
jgi:hypothetical protein